MNLAMQPDPQTLSLQTFHLKYTWSTIRGSFPEDGWCSRFYHLTENENSNLCTFAKIIIDIENIVYVQIHM